MDNQIDNTGVSIESLEPISDTQLDFYCPMCNDPSSDSWVRLVANGEQSAPECAVYYGMDVSAVNMHVYHHRLQCDRDNYGELDSLSPEYINSKLTSIVKILNGWLDRTVTGSPLERGMVSTAIELIEQINKTMRLYSEINGSINSSQSNTLIQINNTVNDVRLLTDGIIDVCCDDCKLKIIDVIDTMQTPKTSVKPKRIKSVS